ncbi:hypothetical protein LXA43DRAFT_968946 [Ganoderma leucocontextum]|nr:hypothetical protein LXA43DRAFT_968946 [Ganoderma leucocontextum]
MDLWASKNEVYEFNQMSSHDRELSLMLNLLKLVNKVNSTEAAVEQLRKDLGELQKYVSGNWNPTKVQEELLTSLLGHWLIKPCRSYDKIHLRVGRYVHLRAEWLHLAIYVTDPVARAVVDRFLRHIIASLKDAKTLDNFARAMLQKYHCPVVPATPPQDTLAALAFLVKGGGGDLEKRFWRVVEAELDTLYDDKKGNGEERDTDPRWKIWELDIIAADRAKHHGASQGSCLAQATTRLNDLMAGPPSLGAPAISFAEDMQANADILDSSHAAPTFTLHGASAVPISFPAHTMDGEVTVSTLGDVASTIQPAL